MQIGSNFFPHTRKIATLAMAGAMTIAASGCTDQYTPATNDPHPTTIYSDGSVSTKIGNTTINSNGTVGTTFGHNTFNSDGSVSTQIGNTVFNSDGTIGYKF